MAYPPENYPLTPAGVDDYPSWAPAAPAPR